MAADAAVTVESSPTEVLSKMTPAERKTWRATGDLPEAKAAEPEKKVSEVKTEAASSPAAKEEVAAPAKVEEPAKPASAEPKEPKANAETRIKDLLAENRVLKQELEKISKQPAAAPAKKEEEVAKPRRNDLDPKTGQPLYATDEAFESAYDQYMTDKVSSDVRKQIAKETAEARVAEQNQLIIKRFENSLKIAQERHPDFLQVVQAKTTEKDGKKTTVFEAHGIKAIKPNGVVDAWTLESDEGSEILYYLATRPEEVERLQALNPFAVARELTKLEDRLVAQNSGKKPPEDSAAPPEKKVKVPPEPAASVGGKGTAPTDEELAATEAGDFRRFAKAANTAEWNAKKK